MYKNEVQKRNEENLQRRFEQDSVPQFIQKYFINLESKSSCITYWATIKQLLNWSIEKKLIKKDSISEIEPEDFLEIEAEDVTMYLRERETNGIAPTTLGTEKNRISSFWEYLVRSRKCPVDYNIVRSVSYRGVSTGNGLFKKLPTDSQMDSMEQKLSNRKDDFWRIRNLAIFYTLKWTGIREIECAGLDLGDVHLDNDMPYISVIGKGDYREIEKKDVFLTDSSAKKLSEWIVLRASMNSDNEALFLTKKGTRVTESAIKELFKYNGNGITPHMMRHWYATFLGTTGNIAFAQQQLRHTSMTTTVNNYSNGAVGMKEMLKGL